jgi:hypothetical protein
MAVSINEQVELNRLHNLSVDDWWRAVIKWLTGANESRSSLAARLVAATGEVGTSFLLSKALAPRTPTQERIKLLEAVERIGLPLAPVSGMT